MENSVNQSQSCHDHSGHVPPLRVITPDIIERLDSFFEFMPPHEFRDHLIELDHNYIMQEHDSLPHNFHQLAEGMSIFMDFLKFADEECSATNPEAVGGEKQPAGL